MTSKIVEVLHENSKLKMENDRLTAEVAALREDAERYRWLRRIDSYNEWNRVGHYAADALDATVDAARTASTVEATTKENDHG